jgi:uncharacterized protein (DUF3820 family)
MTKDQRRFAKLRMPFGRYRNETIATVWLDVSYCGWLLDQDWFKRLHASHYVAITLRPGAAEVDRIVEDHEAQQQARMAAARQEQRDQEAARQAQIVEQEWRRMAAREANAEPGSMPFGKHKGQPLHVVVVDQRYMAFLRRQEAWYARVYDLPYYPNTMKELRDLAGAIVPFPTRKAPKPPAAKIVLNAVGYTATNPSGPQQ